MVQGHIYILQVLFAVGITCGSQSLDFANKHTWVASIARYIIYVLTVQGSKAISVVVYEILNKKRSLDTELFSKVNRNRFIIYLAAVAVVYLNNQKLYAEDLPLMFMAYLIVKYPEMGSSAISLGAGLACSYTEGYLVYVVPPDGSEIKGLQDNIRTFEDQHNVVFPVKRMFVIVTKSMHCPPDLKEFNDKSDREDVNRLEACLSFEGVVKDVAGVKNRNYKNSAYKIIRPNKKPVYIAAECATSLHTLYKVIKNRHLCDVMEGVNVKDIVSDFVCTLRSALDKSPDLRNKCEVVYFDDTDKNLNLSDILLDRIKTLEPNFETYINRPR